MGLSARWNEAAQEAVPVYAMGTCPWTYVDLRNGANAAVRVVLDHLIDKAKTDGDAGAVEAMYALEVELETSSRGRSECPPSPCTDPGEAARAANATIIKKGTNR